MIGRDCRNILLTVRKQINPNEIFTERNVGKVPMLTPRQAIDQGQVWLRPFGHFIPEHQGYMGFSDEATRDEFFNQIEDGALVVVWTRQKDNEDPKWVGLLRGILQLTTEKGCDSQYSSPLGITAAGSTSSEFGAAVRVVRAWEANFARKVMMKNIIPGLWNKYTRTIGQRSKKMPSADLPKLESVQVREVSVFGQVPVPAGVFMPIRKAFV